jgi:hypothetical protein
LVLRLAGSFCLYVVIYYKGCREQQIADYKILTLEV